MVGVPDDLKKGSLLTFSGPDDTSLHLAGAGPEMIPAIIPEDSISQTEEQGEADEDEGGEHFYVAQSHHDGSECPDDRSGDQDQVELQANLGLVQRMGLRIKFVSVEEMGSHRSEDWKHGSVSGLEEAV